MSTKELRVGVVGMGNMGRCHSDHMLKIEGVKLVALCDEFSKDIADKFKNEKNIDVNTYDNYDEMLEKEDLDIMYVCLPPFCHNGQVEKAAAKGLHVFLEKPIALDVNRGKSMVEAIEKNHVYSQVGHQMRFGNAVKRFKELVASGQAGQPMMFIGRYECNSLHSPWWRVKEKCGGQLFEQVIHLYDMAQYLMGNVKECSGRVANLGHKDVEGYTIEDTSISNLVFENGTLGVITGSNCAIKNEWNAAFRVVCQNMTMDFVDQNHATIVWTNKSEGSIEKIDGTNDVSLMEDEYFISVVRNEKPEFANVKEGYSDLKLVSAVVESSENDGKVVKL